MSTLPAGEKLVTEYSFLPITEYVQTHFITPLSLFQCTGPYLSALQKNIFYNFS